MKLSPPSREWRESTGLRSCARPRSARSRDRDLRSHRATSSGTFIAPPSITACPSATGLETQLGITLLGQEYFTGLEGGTLALLRRAPDGHWIYETILELPSEAFAHAFAPDGTLLIKDPYGAIAITKDRKLVPLACP